MKRSWISAPASFTLVLWAVRCRGRVLAPSDAELEYQAAREPGREGEVKANRDLRLAGRQQGGLHWTCRPV
jgi:hypothetical protein